MSPKPSTVQRIFKLLPIPSGLFTIQHFSFCYLFNLIKQQVLRKYYVIIPELICKSKNFGYFLVFCLLYREKRKTWFTSLVTWDARERVCDYREDTWAEWKLELGAGREALSLSHPHLIPSQPLSLASLHICSFSFISTDVLIHPLFNTSSVSSNSMWSLSQGLSRASWHPANGHCLSISWLKATGNSLPIWTRIHRSFISGMLWPIFGSAVTSRILNRDICFKVCLNTRKIFFFHKLLILYWSKAIYNIVIVSDAQQSD